MRWKYSDQPMYLWFATTHPDWYARWIDGSKFTNQTRTFMQRFAVVPA